MVKKEPTKEIDLLYAQYERMKNSYEKIHADWKYAGDQVGVWKVRELHSLTNLHELSSAMNSILLTIRKLREEPKADE